MALASFSNDLPASSLWAANMDVGERHAGSVSGVVGTFSAAGAVISPSLFGFLLNQGWGWIPTPGHGRPGLPLLRPELASGRSNPNRLGRAARLRGRPRISLNPAGHFDMLIGYVSDERYVDLPSVLLEFEDAKDGSVEARSKTSGRSTPISPRAPVASPWRNPALDPSGLT